MRAPMIPLCEMHAPHLPAALTPTESARYQARVFVVLRQEARIARAHVCPTCFENLKACLGDGCTEVSQQEYNDTQPTV